VVLNLISPDVGEVGLCAVLPTGIENLEGKDISVDSTLKQVILLEIKTIFPALSGSIFKPIVALDLSTVIH